MPGFGKSHGLVVKADGSQSRGRGSNPGTVYWIDVSNASYYINININIHEDNENKSSQMVHT